MGKDPYSKARLNVDALKAAAPASKIASASKEDGIIWQAPLNPLVDAIVPTSASTVAKNAVGDDFAYNHLTDSLMEHHEQDALPTEELMKASKLKDQGWDKQCKAWRAHHEGDTSGASTLLGQAALHYSAAANTILNNSQLNPKSLGPVAMIASGSAHKTHHDYLDAVNEGA